MSDVLGDWGSLPPAGSAAVARPATAPQVVSTDDKLDRAANAVDRAENKVRSSQARTAAARAELENVDDALTVAEARLAAYEDSDNREAWQLTKLAKDVEKIKRRRELATAAIENRLAEEETAAAAVVRARASLRRLESESAVFLLGGEDAGEATPELVYGNVVEFVEDYLQPLYRRRTSAWCPEWWKHPEATVRLQALWLSWEQLRTDPALGLSVWLRDHFDHHMTILVSGDGPLKGCKPSGHKPSGDYELKTTTPPAGLFLDERAGDP